jgi:hypothetical protein
MSSLIKETLQQYSKYKTGWYLCMHPILYSYIIEPSNKYATFCHWYPIQHTNHTYMLWLIQNRTPCTKKPDLTATTLSLLIPCRYCQNKYWSHGRFKLTIDDKHCL